MSFRKWTTRGMGLWVRCPAGCRSTTTLTLVCGARPVLNHAVSDSGGLEGGLGKCISSTPRGFLHEVRVQKLPVGWTLRKDHITGKQWWPGFDATLSGVGAQEWRHVWHCNRMNTMSTLLWSPEREMFPSLSTGKIRGFWGLKWSRDLDFICNFLHFETTCSGLSLERASPWPCINSSLGSETYPNWSVSLQCLACKNNEKLKGPDKFYTIASQTTSSVRGNQLSTVFCDLGGGVAWSSNRRGQEL